MLRAVRDRLAALPEWRAPAVHVAIMAVAEEQGVGLGKVAQPIRVAVSGGTVSPPIDVTLEILGRETTLPGWIGRLLCRGHSPARRVSPGQMSRFLTYCGAARHDMRQLGRLTR